MKLKISLFFFLVLFSMSALAQDKAWFVKSSDAKVYAEANKVPILMVFAGSDWCKPCKMLKADILHSPKFEAFHQTKFALLYLDFPMKAKNKLSADLKRQNDLLAEIYNKNGSFPYMTMINTKGEILGELSFKSQTPELFIKQCETLLANKK